MFLLTAALLLGQAPAAADAAKAADDAFEKFKKDFKGNEDDRIAAIKELGKTNHAKVISKLSPIMAAGTPKLKVAVGAALGEFTKLKPQAAAALLSGIAANVAEKGVAWALMDALANLEEPSSVAGLSAYFDHKDHELALHAVSAAGKLGSLSAMDALIKTLEKAEKTLKGNSSTYTANNYQTGTSTTYSADPGVKARAEAMIKACQTALKALTQQQNLETASQWGQWWALNKPAAAKK